MYNLIEYRNNYLNTLGSLWEYYREERVLTDVRTITIFSAAD